MSGFAGRDTAQIDVGDKQGERPKLPRDLTFRTRVLAITPAHDVKLDWRYGGEALGGEVYRGTLANGLAVGQWTPGTPLTLPRLEEGDVLVLEQHSTCE